MVGRRIVRCAVLALAVGVRTGSAVDGSAVGSSSMDGGSMQLAMQALGVHRDSSADESDEIPPFGDEESGTLPTEPATDTDTPAPSTRRPRDTPSHPPSSHRPNHHPLPPPWENMAMQSPKTWAPQGVEDSPSPPPPSQIPTQPPQTEPTSVYYTPPPSQPQPHGSPYHSPSPSTPDPQSPSPPRPPPPSPAQQQSSHPLTPVDEVREADSLRASPSPLEATLSTDTQTPVPSTEAPPLKRYTRGDEVMIVDKDLGNGTIVSVEVIVSASGSPALVVRDTNTLSAGGEASSTESSGGMLVTVLQYVVPGLALSSLLLLIGNHFAALPPAWASPSPEWKQPNQWELLLFISYLQSMASLGYYVLSVAPYAVWQVVDGFSWVVFIPFHGSGSAISTASSRRLVNVVILDGLVAFADRIGVNEVDLLKTTVAGFLVVLGVVLLLGTIVFVSTRCQRQPEQNKPTTMHSVQKPTESKRRPMLIVYGLLVIVAVLALYPLTLMATFEITSQMRASQISPNLLVIAIVMMAMVCLPLIVSSVWVLASILSEEEFQRRRHCRAVWGVLCSSDHVKYSVRVPFVAVWFATQVAAAVTVGLVPTMALQLPLVIGVHSASLVFLVAVRPFIDGQRVAMMASCFIGVLKLVNTAFAGVFGSSARSGDTAAWAFIAINAVVIALWFARQVILTIYMRQQLLEHGCNDTTRASTQVPSVMSPGENLYASAVYVVMPSATSEGTRQTAIV